MAKTNELKPLLLREPPCPEVTLALAVGWEMRRSAEDCGINLSQPADKIMRQFIREEVKLTISDEARILAGERRRN